MNDEMAEAYKSLFMPMIKEWAKANKILKAQPMIVVNSVENGASTPLYYPSDIVNQTQLFTNRTGSSITAGQKVYLVQPIYSDDEGWIGYLPQ